MKTHCVSEYSGVGQTFSKTYILVGLDDERYPDPQTGEIHEGVYRFISGPEFYMEEFPSVMKPPFIVCEPLK